MTPKSDSVASEMESIFKPLVGRECRPAHGETPVASRQRKRPGLSGWNLGVGAALVLVPLVTATLAIGDGRNYSLASGPTGSARPAKAVPVEARGPAGVDRDLGPHLGTQAPPAEVRLTDATVAADPDGPANVAPAPPQPDAAPARPAGTAARAPAARPSLRNRARMRDGSASGTGAARCAPGRSERYCLFEDVLDADARLRMAYDRADRAGVPSDTLTAINRDWRRARRYAETDPRGTIRRYQQLADTLDDERYGYDR